MYCKIEYSARIYRIQKDRIHSKVSVFYLTNTESKFYLHDECGCVILPAAPERLRNPERLQHVMAPPVT